jgi:hypothetical protein
MEEAAGISQRLWEAIGIGWLEDCLEAQGDDVVHEDRLAEEISGGELSLLNGQSGGVDEDCVAYFSADVTGFAILENVDDEPDLAVASMAWLPCSAVWGGKTDKSRRQNGWALRAQGRQRRYER